MKETSKLLLISFLLFSTSLMGCYQPADIINSSSSIIETDKKLEIYQLYVHAGGTLTYEEWLESIKGANGASCLNGTVNPTESIGQNGDTYINTATWNIFVKTGGQWHIVGNIMGPQGLPGEKGSDGTSLLTGAGEPASTLGNDGDSYIDLSTWNYYLKTKGQWTLIDNIKGPQGDPGEAAITYIPAIFNNYDGTMLYTFYYEKGSTIIYDGPTPTRASDWDGGEELNYTFIGWDKSLENIQKPTIFTAQYQGKMYNVDFINYDGEILYSTQVERGKDATFVGAIPNRNDNPSLDWQFTGWDKPLTNITKNTTFVAQFYAPNAIKCEFLNYDETVLSTQYVGNGDTVIYEGAVPTREDENDHGTITKYEFIGWDKSLKNINSDTIFTAQYGTNSYYEVTFVDYDGTLLYTTSTFGGGQVSYEGEEPNRDQEIDGDTITRYAFDGWDKSLSNIYEPTTITATYRSVSFTGYKVTFLDQDNSELYSYYCKSGTDAAYPYDSPFNYDETNVHMFVGWSADIKNISCETTVTAQYMDIPRSKNGEYPQSKVTDEELISTLNELTETNSKGYYEYNGDKYEKKAARWFYKVEPIQWKYLSDNGNTAFLTSEYILDGQRYDLSSNNYKDSEIRNWLNHEFLEKAFDDDSLIVTTTVDNSVASTGQTTNQYVCETTYDKIFLLSRAELMDENLGFASAKSRMFKHTDYAGWSVGIAKCLTRSPYSGSSAKIWSVAEDGEIKADVLDNDVRTQNRYVRPCITIAI